MIIWLVQTVIGAYILLVIGHVIMSWTGALRGTEAERWVNTAVEPALAPLRQLLDPLQKNTGLDFSPALLIIILAFLEGLLT